MRTLEIAIAALLGAYLAWPHPRPLPIRLAPAAALLVTLIHFAIEGYRWQMIPLYALAALLAVSALIKIHSPADWKSFASYLTFILLAVSTALPILLPVPSIPRPGGNYSVGAFSLDLVDPSRRELYSGRDEPRKFQIQVWYPAVIDAKSKPAPWMSRADIYAPTIAKYLNLPSFFLDHLALVHTPAYMDAPFAQPVDQFPVVIFSHGWNGFAAQNSGQAIELASHGYIVIGVQHTYGALTTVFEDGTIAPNNPSALPEGLPSDEYEAAARKLVDQWAGDIAYTLDHLTTIGADSGLVNFSVFDMDQVGAYGHSTGGGTAIEFCSRDPRCKAVLGLDPFMRPVSFETLENGITQPSFFVFSQRWADDVDSRNFQLFNEFYRNAKASLGVISIDGTSHYDFSDLPLLSPLAPQLGLKGPINGKRVTAIVNNYLLSFFDATLKGLSTSLFDEQIQKYEEVHFIH